MKIWVFSTSRGYTKGALREFDGLQDCIETLRKETKPDMTFVVQPSWYPFSVCDDEDESAEYAVEIYDDYRE